MKNTIERFFSYVNKTETCWIWIGATTNGYGLFSVKNKRIRAHRFSYEINFGKIPKGFFACHSCDNPPCVRPDHIFLGTQSDNMKDCFKKGRSNIIEAQKIGNRKLTKEIVDEIRKSKEKPFIKAKKYGVSYRTIYDIMNGFTWK